MTIHAIQTGSVRIKRSQVRGSGHGMRRRLRVFTDPEWTDWIPIYAWLIDHPEGIIVVDTGQGRHLLDSVHSLHPYRRWAVRFRIERDEEIGPQLRALGVKPREVQRVVLTHLHIDHDGDWRTFRRVRSSRPGENCTPHAVRWVVCVDTCRTDGQPGSIRPRSISPLNRSARSPQAGV